MIKNLWDRFVTWLFSWQKEEKDPNAEWFLDVPEPEVPVLVEEKIKCNTHLRFKKSCPICVAGAK